MSAPMSAIRAATEGLKTLAFGSIVVGYARIGTVFQYPPREITIQNNTDVGLFFSLDGVVDWTWLPSGGARELDLCSNRTDESGAMVIPAQSSIWVRRDGVPTLGNVMISSLYGQQ